MASVQMQLQKVNLNSDVYAACLQHALSSEKEEVMGLLIGEVNEEECSSVISAYMILQRSDKQPDRVEISPEQLSKGSQYAEELSSRLEKPMRILGWYHSHPHITVWPSHVDLRTQFIYQMMDPLFVGLIFSVYQVSSLGGNCTQITAFQSDQRISDYERRTVELIIANTALQSPNLYGMSNLPEILKQEMVSHVKEQKANIAEDTLTMLHNDAMETIDLIKTVKAVSLPLCEAIEARQKAVEARIKELEIVKQELLSKHNLTMDNIFKD